MNVRNGFVVGPETPRSRVQRLVLVRELRKSSRFSNQIEDSGDVSKETDLVVPEDQSSNSVKSEEPSGLPKQRLLVVANRLPVSAVRDGNNSWSLKVSLGGLVSALLGVKEFDIRWVGWPGMTLTDVEEQKALTNVLAEKRCIPVFLSEEIFQQYYDGYCNNMLWPLFHYLGLPQEDRFATTSCIQSQFNAYKKANQAFADVVNQHYREGDIVWCHDYHLMFLPKCLKQYNCTMKVGWFLHTPFPSSEIHRMLHSRSELLRTVLAADLIGFHTYDYARHFVSACTRILGLEGTPEGVEDQGKLTRVAAFPIGIDSDRFIRTLELKQVQNLIAELKARFGKRKIILGVDRLDMIKGIPQKILAFEQFLEENPEWRDKVILLQIAAPTRTNVSEYQKLRSHVHEIVGRINGRFGTLTAVPIHHLDRSFDFHELCALYAVTDVALVTSLRDGMNLVSYEFVACQASKKGVLILSEFAGAAQSLGAGAILVNPWNLSEVASAIAYALTMPAEEREKRFHLNFMHVTTHTSQEWAETFISELNDSIVEAQLRKTQVPPALPVNSVVEKFLKSNNRLLILGFISTLTEQLDPLGRREAPVRQLEPRLHRCLQEPLKKLCDDPNTTVVIISGSGRTVLDDNFCEFNMWLAAENGVFLRHTSSEWMTTLPENVNMDWIESVKHVFEYFTDRTPRSHFELRETSLLWNYKYADIEFGRLQAKDMLQHLWTGPISNAALEIIQGSRSVEVRPSGVTKGAAIDRILGEIVRNGNVKSPIDYVISVGHHLPKDEDIFTFFEPQVIPDPPPPRLHNKSLETDTAPSAIRPESTIPFRKQRSLSTLEKKNFGCSGWRPVVHKKAPLHEGSSVLDLKAENYFSCSVTLKRSCARYQLGCSDDVAALLAELARSLG